MQKCFKSVLKIFLCLSWNNNYSKVENDLKNFSLKHDIAGYMLSQREKMFPKIFGIIYWKTLSSFILMNVTRTKIIQLFQRFYGNWELPQQPVDERG